VQVGIEIDRAAKAGAEAGTSLLATALAGTNLIHDVGYLESGLTGSLESIVLGADMIRWTQQYVAGVEVTPETLALATTAEVGPGGHFLDRPHTLRYFRDGLLPPYVLDRDIYDNWQASGCREYAARARDLARELLDSHRAAPLDEAVDARLRELAGVAVSP
jgi:trimethylamine--corrinoid protein Co-methyltransferase